MIIIISGIIIMFTVYNTSYHYYLYLVLAVIIIISTISH